MSSDDVRTEAVSVDEQGLEKATADSVEDEPVRPTVEMETQAKVDANHPDGGLHGLPLQAEGQAIAREAEKARTHGGIVDKPPIEKPGRDRSRQLGVASGARRSPSGAPPWTRGQIRTSPIRGSRSPRMRSLG